MINIPKMEYLNRFVKTEDMLWKEYSLPNPNNAIFTTYQCTIRYNATAKLMHLSLFAQADNITSTDGLLVGVLPNELKAIIKRTIRVRTGMMTALTNYVACPCYMEFKENGNIHAITVIGNPAAYRIAYDFTVNTDMFSI